MADEHRQNRELSNWERSWLNEKLLTVRADRRRAELTVTKARINLFFTTIVRLVVCVVVIGSLVKHVGANEIVRGFLALR